MTVGKLCSRSVVVVDRQGSVHEAARLMREHHVGDVVVVEDVAGRRVPVGILTDRDIVVGLEAPRLDLDAFSVRDVMSADLTVVGEDDDLLDAIERMEYRGVRRAPVVDRDGALVGILTADDLVDVVGGMLSRLGRLIAREQYRERRLRG